MSSRLRKLTLLALVLLAASALTACGESHTKVKGGTYAGESGANAPYLDVGPLVYEVQLSRELNPYSVEDSAYLQGLSPAERKLEPGQEWFGVFLQVYNNGSHTLPAASDLTITDTQENRYIPIVPGATNEFAYRAGNVAGQRPPAGARLDRLRRPDAGRAAAVQDPDRLAGQPPAHADDRRPGRRGREGVGRARRLAAGLQPRFEHLARDRRGGVAAGAVFDEQHADDDARLQRRREGGEPRVGVARFAVGADAARRARFLGARIRSDSASPEEAVHSLFSSAVPVLPATVTPGIAAEVPVPSRTTPIISRRTVCATRGAGHARARQQRGRA